MGPLLGTVVSGTGQSIFKCRTSSGNDISAKQSRDRRCMQVCRRRLLQTPNKQRKKKKRNAVGCSSTTSSHELSCSCFGFGSEELSFSALLKVGEGGEVCHCPFKALCIIDFVHIKPLLMPTFLFCGFTVLRGDVIFNFGFP